MDKTLVEVYVPILAKPYDMFIPKNVLMSDVLELIKKAVSDLSEGRFVSDSNTVICYRNSGTIIDINRSVAELKIKNGSKLMLV